MTRLNSFLPRTLAEAKDELGISVEIDSGGKPLVWYYVETTYRRATDGNPMFKGNLVMAARPKDAERKAIEQTRAEVGVDAEHYMTRRLTEAKAQKILDSFNAGTWEGWRF